jgi:hypothetical protein
MHFGDRSGDVGGFMRPDRIVRLLALVLSVWLWSALASAQVTTATVVGTVKDAQGGVIPGATVTLTSEKQGTKLAETITNSSGDFVFPNVTADTYTVQVAMSGFKTLKRSGVDVHPGDRLTVPGLVIEIGEQNQEITVTAETPVIQAQSGERSYTVTTESVQNLPIANRSFVSLVALAPGTNGTARLGAGGATNAMFDGIGIIDTGSNSIQLQMNVEAVAEVKVLASSYQAEYGRSSGLQISAVTKSGSNRIHGSVYDVKRNSDWNANSWVNQQNGTAKTITKQDDWGYSIGGPVGKAGGANKLFYFFSQEWRPRTIGGQVTHFRVPTAAERSGDFSQSRDNNGALFPYIKDPNVNGTCSASSQAACFADGGVLGRIPTSRLYPIGLNVLNMWPVPNDDAGYAATSSYNYSSVKPTVNSHGRQEAIRGDYQISPNLRLNAKLITQDNSHEPNNNDIRFGTGTTSLIPGFNDMVDWVPLMLQWSSTLNYNINATTFFEASYGGFYNQIATTPIDPASNKNNVGLGAFPMLFPDASIIDPSFYSYQILTKLGGNAPPYFVGGRSLVPPSFSWGGRVANAPPNITDFGCCFTLNRVQDVNLSLTKVMGGHTAKAGFYLDHSYKPQTAGVGATGSYRGTVSFANDPNNPLDSGFGFANAALGVFTSYQQANRFLEGDYVYNNVEWYVQDNWKTSKKLTLDYGLRFVHQSPQYDTHGFSSQFFEQNWDASKAPVLFRPVCAPGTIAPCNGQNVRAQNPLTGEILGPGSSSIVGQLVPGSGNLTNGVYPAGVSPNVKENYTWPSLLVAPRAGFAYDLTGAQRVVLRGGAGLFFDRPDGNSMFGQITNPPAQSSVTVNNGTLQGLSSGLQVSAPPGMTIFQFDAGMPSSINWNAGAQFALRWSSSLDVEYVGIRGYNLLASTDINAPDFGAAYLPENQNPTLASSAVPGATALPVNFYRPFRGFGAINRNMTVGYNNFHSLQMSLNRRFSHGVSFTLNYTLSRNKGTAGNGVRITRDSSGQIVLRSDQDQANYNITGNDRTHTIKGNFVWDLPDLKPTGGVESVVAAIINDWQLSGVLTAGSGAPYTVGFLYTNGTGATNLTGTPNYNARIVITGDPGSGCSSDRTRQFNTAAFAGPQPGSYGLESGQNYMKGCPDHTLDLAIARNIRVGGSRSIQLRAEMYNALNTVIFTGRNSTMNMANLSTASVATNLPYDANGNLIPTSIIPRSAGFGVVNNSNAARSVQVTARFSF